MKKDIYESKIQSYAYTRLYNSRPDLRGRIFAINNNSEDARSGAINKAMGTYEGIADMCFMCDKGVTVWIEWKTEDGVQSKAQKSWEVLITELGHNYVIVRNESQFLDVIDFFE